MTQIERIKKMEQILDEATSAVSELANALEKYRASISSLKALSSYYEGGAWFADYNDDQAGKIPHDLKRGVLSEDAVWNLLSDNDEALDIMKRILNEANAKNADANDNEKSLQN